MRLWRLWLPAVGSALETVTRAHPTIHKFRHVSLRFNFVHAPMREQRRGPVRPLGAVDTPRDWSEL